MSEKLKLTLGQIGARDANGVPVFMRALHKLRHMPLGKDAYAVGKSIRIIQSEYDAYDEAYVSIVKKYGKQMDGGGWMIERTDAEKYPAATQEILELQKKDFEIHLESKIKLPDVGTVAEQLNQLSVKIMNSRLSQATHEQIVQASGQLASLVNEWRSMVLTPDDAMQLEALIEG